MTKRTLSLFELTGKWWVTITTDERTSTIGLEAKNKEQVRRELITRFDATKEELPQV